MGSKSKISDTEAKIDELYSILWEILDLQVEVMDLKHLVEEIGDLQARMVAMWVKVAEETYPSPEDLFFWSPGALL